MSMASATLKARLSVVIVVRPPRGPANASEQSKPTPAMITGDQRPLPRASCPVEADHAAARATLRRRATSAITPKTPASTGVSSSSQG